jgi:hypothetical protein
MSDRVYSKESPHSFFRDLEQGFLGDRGAQQRLQHHEDELQEQVVQDSPEGRRVVRERARALRLDRPNLTHAEREAEARAMTSTSAVGWTTPQYIVKEFAVYKGSQRAFADQCTTFPLPEVGMAVHVPDFTGSASAGVQTEGQSLTSFEQDPAGTDLTAPVITIAGQVVTSQQTLDRGTLPGGFSFDMFIYAQLRQNYDQSLDNYVLGQAIGQGVTLVGTTSAATWFGNYYLDLRSAREALEDTQGNRVYPTHVFSDPDLLGYATDQLDANGRPILLPQFAPGNPLWPDENPDTWEQFTGIVLPSNLLWFIEPNVPPIGTNTRVVVSKPDTIVLWENEDPILRVVPNGSLAGNLQAMIQLYNYVACIPRYPHATASISGTNYALTNV